MPLSKLPTRGSFAKMADLAAAEVILFEPTGFAAQVPTKFGPKDEITVALTIFKDLKSEPEVLVDAKLQSSVLVKDLRTLIGQQVAATVAKVQGDTAAFWVLREASAEAEAHVEKYLAERDAALEAAPDFLLD